VIVGQVGVGQVDVGQVAVGQVAVGQVAVGQVAVGQVTRTLIKQNQKLCFKVKFIVRLVSAVYWTQNKAKLLTKKSF
jgi:hypothetical protein